MNVHTSADQDFTRERVMHELRRRQLTVLRSAMVAPHLLRITLGGEQLQGFTAPGPSDHIKLFLPDPENGSFAVPPGARLAMRDYTPLAFRDEGGDSPELDIDVVLHGAAGSDPVRTLGDRSIRYGGPAASWAANVQPGDPALIAGPRGSQLPPRWARRAILIADESALPAVRRWCAALGDTPTLGLCTLDDPATASYLDECVAAHRSFEWFRYEADSASVLQRLRDTTIDSATFVFLAGEAGALIPLRRYLRRELRLPASQVEAHGYWKKGVVALDHHAPLDPDDPED